MKRFAGISWAVLFVLNLSASLPALERPINLFLTNEKISNALQRIQDQAGLIFSYRPALISSAAPVSVQLKNKTVREALLSILPANITYRSKNNYIILKEKPKAADVSKTVVSGYVYDKITEEKIPNVTIYDKVTLQSVTTDEYGYYSITVPAESPSLTVSKAEYQDTVIPVATATSGRLLNISMLSFKSVLGKKDSLHLREKFNQVNEYSKKVFSRARGYINTLNIKDTIARSFQVSVFPFVGTNHRLSGNVYNRLSLNVYGGYARGLNGAEVGGLFNIEKENVSGFQAAGLFNVVGNKVRGTQLAGLLNIDGDTVRGFQAAGLMNINEGYQTGFQAAGLMNIGSQSKGLSAAGLMNVSKSSKGAQIAGLANISDTSAGIVIAGLFNNEQYGHKSSQIAGLFNKSASGTSRFQLAGLFNSAGTVTGMQVSMFNYADSAAGIPVGLLSFVKKGVHQLELHADEIFYTNISLRTGVNRFYNIVSVGMQPGSSATLWQLGYGLGTSLRMSEKINANLNLSVHHVSKGYLYFSASEIYKLYIGAEYKVGKKFSVAAGPAFNIYITDKLTPDYTSSYSGITPHGMFSGKTADDYQLSGWIGARVALRFF